MANILVADDEVLLRRFLNQVLLRNGHSCTLAANSVEARKCLAEQSFDLALCDVDMPGETGIDLARHIRAEYPDTAVIIVTAVDDSTTAAGAIEIGTDGYILKPLNINELIINVRNVLRRRKLEIANRMHRQDLEQSLKEQTPVLKKALLETIKVIARTVEVRDPYTAGHQQRVANLSVAIAKEMNLTADQIEGIGMAGMIHDLGKIFVPVEILTKPGGLSEIEFAFIATHPKSGYDIIADIEFPWPVAQMVLQHHERMNGTGYPQGLAGESILLEARILCVADVVESMASHRPYSAARGIDVALDEISSNRGVLYDPKVVDACLRIFETGNYKLDQPVVTINARYENRPIACLNNGTVGGALKEAACAINRFGTPRPSGKDKKDITLDAAFSRIEGSLRAAGSFIEEVHHDGEEAAGFV